MSDCFQLSDRMPEVLRGQDTWSREDAAHLSACADCRAELDLARAGMALGASAPTADPGRLASQVLLRVRTTARQPVLGRLRRVGWAVAAAAVLVLGVSLVVPGPSVPAAEPGLIAALHELDGLDDAELERLLGRVTGPASEGAMRIDALDAWGDLTDAEWLALLSTLEG